MSSEHAGHGTHAGHTNAGGDAAHGKAAYDDINIRSLALVGGVGALLVFVAVISVQVVYLRYDRQERQRKIVDVPFLSAEETLAAQRERLTKAGDGAFPENGEKSIPIDQAMKEVLASIQKRQAASASKDDVADKAPVAE